MTTPSLASVCRVVAVLAVAVVVVRGGAVDRRDGEVDHRDAVVVRYNSKHTLRHLVVETPVVRPSDDRAYDRMVVVGDEDDDDDERMIFRWRRRADGAHDARLVGPASAGWLALGVVVAVDDDVVAREMTTTTTMLKGAKVIVGARDSSVERYVLDEDGWYSAKRSPLDAPKYAGWYGDARSASLHLETSNFFATTTTTTTKHRDGDGDGADAATWLVFARGGTDDEFPSFSTARRRDWIVRLNLDGDVGDVGDVASSDPTASPTASSDPTASPTVSSPPTPSPSHRLDRGMLGDDGNSAWLHTKVMTLLALISLAFVCYACVYRDGEKTTKKTVANYAYKISGSEDEKEETALVNNNNHNDPTEPLLSDPENERPRQQQQQQHTADEGYESESTASRIGLEQHAQQTKCALPLPFGNCILPSSGVKKKMDL